MLRKSVLLLFIILISLRIWGQLVSQFNPYPFVISDEEKEITVLRQGKYGNHWLESSNGYRIVNTNGNFVYATNKSGEWESSGISVYKDLNKEEQQLLQEYSQYTGKIYSPGLHLKSGSGIGGIPSSGELKLPVICIEYSDLKHSRSKEDIEKMFNQEGYKGNLCLSEYFQQSSHGKLNLSFDVVGWVSTGDSHSKYAESKGMYNTGYMVKKAILAANAEGVDFAQYDNDNDGDVDCVIIVHAGLGAEEIGDERYIWAHSWSLSGTGAGELNLDGKKIDAYNVGCELRRESDAGIGMKCHELGHALGLPDLYDGTGQSSGLGYWCMMSSAPWLNEARPGNFSAWCRVKLGWDEPLVMDYNNVDTLTLSASINPNQIVRIDTRQPNEFFLIENRQKQGIDYRLPGTGLAIYHCNQNKIDSGSGINDDRDNPGIRFVEADFNKAQGLYNAKDRGNAGDLFPGTKQVTELGYDTNPSSRLFDGSHSGVLVTSIKEEGGKLHFELKKSPSQILWHNMVFRESPESKGEIANAVPIELLEAQWKINEGKLPSSAFQVSNLSAGLDAEIVVKNANEAELQITGKAQEHNPEHSISDLTISFLDAAFSENDTSEIGGRTQNNLEIRYREALANDIVWREDFELYNIGETPDLWQIEAEDNVEMQWQVRGDVEIVSDVASFTCEPAQGERALVSSENWFGNGPKQIRLISPKIDFQNAVQPKLSFYDIRGWDNVWPEVKTEHAIELEFSENKTDWQPIASISFNETSFSNWQLKSDIALDACAGKTGYLAFKSNTHSYYWQIDNVQISNAGLAVKQNKQTFTKVYPNPAKNLLWVETSKPLQSAEIVNVFGSSIKLFKLENRKSKISVADLPNGIYLLKIIYLSGEKEVLKIQKQ